MDAITGFFSGLKEKIVGTAQSAASPVQTALPDIATDKGSTSLLGTPAEPSGMTMTGGRKHRRRTAKKGGSKKTHRKIKHRK
jgi:hypothetical protein